MDDRTRTFEAERPRLMGLAYRLLGSVSDAQDVVQDTYVKWALYRGPAIGAPAAWLSRVCANGCLDRLKSAERTRVAYVGPWLPDQIQTEYEAGPEERMEIASSLTTAFLLLLERLTPKERAAYLLHDIFGVPFDEVASVLDLSSANCRKLAARARGFVSGQQVRHIPDAARQSELLAAFRGALETGNTESLGRVLRADADLRADSGGKVVAARTVIEGTERVLDFVATVLAPAWTEMRVSPTTINGMEGLVIGQGDTLHAAVSFSYDRDGHVRHIFIMRHPEKLALLRSTRGVAARGGALLLQ